MQLLGWTFMFFGAISAFCTLGILLLLLVDALLKRAGAEKPRCRTLFYCERCEQQTARKFTSNTATVMACRCGFRRCVRDDVYPRNVGVLHDPGPIGRPTPQE